MNPPETRAVDAFSATCHAAPALSLDSASRRGVGLYGWRSGPVDEVHLPETGDLILSLHLGGARRVRLFTERGLTRSVSRPGDLTLMPHGRPIGFRTEGAVDFATLHFPSYLAARHHVAEWASLQGLRQCLFAFRDDYVSANVRALMRAAHATSADSTRYRRRLFDALVVHLAQLVEARGIEPVELPTCNARAPRAPNFEAVLAHIEQHLGEKLGLDELAALAGVSRALFAREFTARFGCAPHRYLNRRRVERAKDLLRLGGVSLADVAYEVGFCGQSHLATIFKAFEGRTPSAYLRSVSR